MADDLPVFVTSATFKTFVIQRLLDLSHKIDEVHEIMTDLNTALGDLQTAVSNVGTRITSVVQPLRDALSSAQQQVSDLTAHDVADEASIADLQARLQAALDQANSAADTIEGNVTALNQLASAPADQIPSGGDVSQLPGEPPADTGTGGTTGDTGTAPPPDTSGSVGGPTGPGTDTGPLEPPPSP